MLLTQEDDFIYENAFNTILSIYLGKIEYLHLIYPNTYIVGLGRKSHDFDILLVNHGKKCVIVAII